MTARPPRLPVGPPVGSRTPVDGEVRATAERTDRRTVTVHLTDDGTGSALLSLSPRAAYALGAQLCRLASSPPDARGGCTLRGALTLSPRTEPL